ncbi:two-component system osmolarity sensor histidine kinase EnvZ [Rhodoligotrophos appendicifer]|uniref:ATP-binding protein n=1 Tax=Rhodoligotrophos appendicifer TaxID=987056 RepID=UPI0011847037|nr:ATP-binding protein [Rhodoligotrophos appendicifer]
MSSITDVGPERAVQPGLYWRFNRFLERHLPDGLYPRSLIIIITPIVLLQSIMAFIFMERHWDRVTKQLSKSVAREIALIVEAYDYYPKTPENRAHLLRMANDTLDLGLSIVEGHDLPPPAEKPLFSLLDIKLSKYIARFVDRPFWLDTLGRSGYVDVRVEVAPGMIFRVLTNQSRAYASNTHIFLLWMVGSSLVLMFVAVIFLRNQIKPILQLAEAAQSFGMGRDVPPFQPRGAAEVQVAALAFNNMRERIERHVEQRTAMLAGVSHDLRTILTRFKLELACLGDTPQTQELKRDADEMQGMLEDYMAFVRGDGGERSVDADISSIVASVARIGQKRGRDVHCAVPEELWAPVKPNAYKRCLANLVGNAARHAANISISASLDDRHLTLIVDDDGPGIAPSQREAVFRPFFRLDDARNQDESGTGLGLAIARDIARSHGGDITLADSPKGGLRAIVQTPVW